MSSSQLYHYFADKGALVAAVIELQGQRVLDVQHLGLDRVNCVDDLWRWRDLVMGIRTAQNCVGGCPLGSLAADLSETDAWLGLSWGGGGSPSGSGFCAPDWQRWRRPASSSTALTPTVSPLHSLPRPRADFLLSQVHRDTAALAAAMDTVIAQIGTHLTEAAAKAVRHR